MMMRPLNKKESRWLAIGLLALCILVCGMLVYAPARMLTRHYDGARDNLMDFLARYQRISATRGQIQTALDQVKKLDGRKHFLKNTGAALAASEIQEIAKSLIEGNGSRLNSIQVVPQKDEGGYHRVTVTIQMMGNTTNLRKILYTIETMQPYLIADNFSIRSQPNAMYRPQPGYEPEVVTQFDLSGYTLVADSK